MELKEKALGIFKPLLVILLSAIISSCSKDEEHVMPTYFLKITQVSDNLEKNNNAMFQLNQLKISQYDEGKAYMQTEEAEALQRFQKTISIIEAYDWSRYGIEPGSSFTLQLVTYEGQVVSSQQIILKR